MHFRRDSFTPNPVDAEPMVAQAVPELREFFSLFSGLSFEKGLYRVMNASSLAEANSFIAVAFPFYSRRAKCFAYDWFGRIFALDMGRMKGGEPEILMFELMEVLDLEVPCNLVNFHDSELINEREVVLDSKWHAEWLARGESIPMPDRCVGLKKPLFLGGEFAFDNMEATNLSVYWHMTAELIKMTRGLPHGTRIRDILLGN